MADTVKRALDMVSRYQDPAHPKMAGWNWQPLSKVRDQLGGLPEIPSHVENFGSFMDETARRAMKQGLTPRDLIKAYVITRASIQRRAQKAEKLRASGLQLPPSAIGNIRPEGAMGEWLHSPMGQRYLDQAERGKVDEEAVAHAQQVMKPFGLGTETDALPWAVEHLGPRHKEVSDMVARALTGQSKPEEWREFAKGMRGIGTAKAGFVASMLGRGDQPTLDARQVILQTGKPTSEAQKPLARAGYAAVDRLAARQAALNPRLDPALEPFRQHLTHHAIWDKAGNEETTHEDVMNAMRHAADGGRIGYGFGGTVHGEHLIDLLAQLDPKSVTQDMVRKALEASRTTGFKRTGAAMLMRDPELRENLPKMTGIDPKSSKSGHLVMPFEDMEADYVPKGNLDPWKEFDIEKAKEEGASVVPLVGDNTPANTVLRAVNGIPTGTVNQQGGGDYTRSEFARGDNPSGWRSRAIAAKTMQKKIDQYGKDGPVYGLHVAMGLGSADSSHMLLHTIINQINHLPIKNEDIRAFDEKIAKRFPNSARFPMEWPGIRNTQKVHDFFYNNGRAGNHRPGSHVSDFIDQIDKVAEQKAGFPNVAAARFANAEPRLLGEKQLSTGYAATKLKPNADLVMNNSRIAHGTYEGGLPHEGYAGGFAAPVQASEIWRDDFAGMPKKVRGKPIDYTLPEGKTLFQQTLLTRFPAQKVDAQMADAVQAARERRARFGRYATGGTVQPTEAQKAAGNYKKDHISFQGLPISIETRKGHMRTGPGWQVRVPYDYGYIKRTEGADGDHVDVCIGPDHQSDHVFIVDQHDHQTGQFDEHKVMLGYRTREDARRAYCAGFSDGKGPDRMKNMVRMTMREFKTWLKLLNTKKPTKGQSHIDRALEVASVYHKRHDRDAG